MSTEPWYADGLRFECTGCGDCCRGAPGTVLVTDEEIEALAARLELPEEEFRRRYTRVLSSGAVSLRDRPPDYECVFWDREEGCTVYEDRPRQCRTWPFWKQNVQSPRHWDRTARDCPGIGEGPVHDREFIEITIADDGTSASR